MANNKIYFLDDVVFFLLLFFFFTLNWGQVSKTIESSLYIFNITLFPIVAN